MKDLLLRHPTAVITAVALCAGLAVALIAWLLSRTLAEVPPEDRKYRDRPPLGFRLMWMPIHWLSFFLGPLISGKEYERILARLRQAGLDYTINPAQFLAARFVVAMLLVLLCWWGVSVFDKGPSDEGLPAMLYLQVCFAGALLGFYYPAIWLRDVVNKRRSELFKTFPFFLDIIVLCVEAGLNMQGALSQAVAKGPPGVVRDEVQRVLRDIRAGKPRAESLRGMSDRLNQSNITAFVSSVIQAEAMGMNLGPILRAQADQRRIERFLRAEKLAMEAPVKMLFPLIAFIFPCTFVVLFFPIVMKFMHAGL